MKKAIVAIRNKGFTLIEVLVTVVVIGVLAAVVIPAVTAQVSAGDSSRVLSDLNNVRTGIENFDIAVRQYPGDIDDLVNSPGIASSSGSGASIDADLTGALYVSNATWAGPYLETALASSVTSSTVSVSAPAFNSGYASTINNHISGCKITDLTLPCNASGADYAVVSVNGLTSAQAASLDTYIDGSAASTTGKFRYVSDATSSTGYYFATPFK